MSALDDVADLALGPEDRAILDLECATVVGHACMVLVLGAAAGGPVAAAALRERIRSRLAAAPELRFRLAGTTERPVWHVVDDLDLDEHVVDRPGAPVDEAGLRAVVAEVFARHLDRTRPLWAIDVVALASGGTAVLWRLHHALADGTTAVRLARCVLLDDVSTEARPVGRPDSATLTRDHARRRVHLGGFLRREFTPEPFRSPFDGTIGTRREIAFVDARFSAVHDAARAYGGTVNDAVLSLVAGALRRWLEHRGARVSDLRVRVPVSLHHGEGDALNHDCFFTLPLPLHITDPVTRLQAIHHAATRRKADDDGSRMDHLLHDDDVPLAVRRWIERVQAGPRAFAVSVSNVVGPRGPVTLLGRTVRSIRPVAEIGLRHGLRVGAMSAGDALGFGFCADPAIVEDVEVLAEGLEQETGLLLRATGHG